MLAHPILLNDARLIVSEFVKVADGESVTVITDASFGSRLEGCALHHAV